MKVAQNEIFGPVFCAIPFNTRDDAVRIANDARCRLSGSISTIDHVSVTGGEAAERLSAD